MNALDQLRAKLKEIDKTIIESLLEREKVVKKIGLLKKKLQIEVIDRDQENKIMENYKALSLRYNIEFDYLKSVFTVIIKHSREIQKNEKF